MPLVDSTYDTGACRPNGKTTASLSTPLLKGTSENITTGLDRTPHSRHGKSRKRKRKTFHQHLYFSNLNASLSLPPPHHFPPETPADKGARRHHAMHAGKLMTHLNKTNHDRCLLSVLTFYPSFEKCNYSDNVIPAQI